MDRYRSSSFLLQHAKSRMFSTVVILGGIIIAFLFAYAAFGKDSDGSTLKSLSIIFRHGDKTITSTYPTDPYKDGIFWPEGWGQLTNKGKQQMFQLGQHFKSRYGQFVGPYSSLTVRVDSSDHDRCHQSAGALLAALFPPTGGQVWNSQLLWQPIPIHSLPLHMDKLITVKYPCPLFEEEKRRSDAELAAEYDNKLQDLYSYLSTYSGQNISSLLAVETLFNILEIEKSRGKTLPSWTAPVFPDKMKHIAALVLASFSRTPLMKRFRGGPLIKDMINNMNLYMSGESQKKLSLYAAHDMTLVNVRRALGFDDFTFKPELGAALILELHVIDDTPQVEIYYLESYAATSAEQWELPGCEAPCSLASFIQVLAPSTPEDWDLECQQTH